MEGFRELECRSCIFKHRQEIKMADVFITGCCTRLPCPEESAHFTTLARGCRPYGFDILPPALVGRQRFVEQFECFLTVRIVKIVADNVMRLGVNS